MGGEERQIGSPNEEFFDAPTEASKTKISIVTKYFKAWSQVISSHMGDSSRKLAYVDLYAGPGYYMDDTKSTPLLILEQAISTPALRESLVTVFNDADEETAAKLSAAIRELPGVDTLKNEPVVRTMEVGSEIATIFQSMKLVPTILFLDPWGYKGLSFELINSVLKDWACECIFFFNYNRINMGISNSALTARMDEVLGKDRANAWRAAVKGQVPVEREKTIIIKLSDALTETYGKFVLPFRFYSEGSTRVSHFLVHVTKGFRGYEIMKRVMAGESSSSDQGVPSFEYDSQPSPSESLDGMGPMADLEAALLKELAGKRLPMKRIYELHSVGTPFIEPNYKEVLKKLEAAGKISAFPPAADRRPNTFGPKVVVEFPEG